jgi:hypothetical protein
MPFAYSNYPTPARGSLQEIAKDQPRIAYLVRKVSRTDEFEILRSSGNVTDEVIMDYISHQDGLEPDDGGGCFQLLKS